MRPPRSPRPLSEMVERLREHTALLRTYVERAKGGDRSYLGEVAAKIRLLAIEGRTNKALMLGVGEAFHGTPRVTIEGPPGWVYMDGHKAGDKIPLAEWLGSFQMAVRTASSPDEPVRMSRRDFVLVWAQQQGAAHEDWELDERFQASRDFGPQISGAPINDHLLIEIAEVVLARAEELLAWITPEKIATAERGR